MTDSMTTTAVTPAHRIGWVGVGAALVAFVGSFLPWASVSSVFGSETVPGTDANGKLALMVALVAGFCLWWAVRGESRAAAVAAGLAGVTGAVIGLYDFVNLADQLRGSRPAIATINVGFGLYLCLAGFVAVAVCAMVTRAKISPTSPATFAPPVA